MVGIEILCNYIATQNRLDRIRGIPIQIHTIFNSKVFRDAIIRLNSKLKLLDRFIEVQKVIFAAQRGINGELKILVVPWYHWKRLFKSKNTLYIPCDQFDDLPYQSLCSEIITQYFKKLEDIPDDQIRPLLRCFNESFDKIFKNKYEDYLD